MKDPSSKCRAACLLAFAALLASCGGASSADASRDSDSSPVDTTGEDTREVDASPPADTRDDSGPADTHHDDVDTAPPDDANGDLDASPTDTDPGDLDPADAEPGDGDASPLDTADTTPPNAPPTLSAVALTSSEARPTLHTTLTCAALEVVDPDGDALAIHYEWFVSDRPLPSDEYDAPTLAGAFRRGDTVRCRVTVSDAVTSASRDSEPIQIRSAPPRIGAVTVSGQSICAPFRCDVADASDDDGDPVTFDYRWTIDDLPVASTAEILEVPLTTGASVRCAVTPRDGVIEDGVAVVGTEVLAEPVIAVDLAPTLSLHLTEHARAGDLLTCVASASDDCAAVTPGELSWTVNDLPVPGTAATFSTAGLHTGDVIACRASTTDGAETVSAVSNTVAIASSRLTLMADIANGLAGYAVAVIDDLDGDAYAEIAIGAPNTTFGAATQAGAVYLVSGRDDVDALGLRQVITGEAGHFIPGDRGGFDVQLMACGPAFYVGGCPKLRDVGEMTADIEGPAGAGLGFALGYSGDLDGDGVGDLVVGSPYELIGDLWRGRTYVLSGTNLSGRPLEDATLGVGGFVFDGECGRRRGLDLKMSSEYVSKAANGDLSGYRVAGLGDVNGDGLGDYAVSAPNHGDRDEGTVYVVFGRTDRRGVTGDDLFQRGCAPVDVQTFGPESGVAGFAAYGPNVPPANAFPIRWGKLIAPAGDFNGDGYEDTLVPSPGFGATNSAFILFGGPRPMPVPLQGGTLTTRWEVYLGDFQFVNGQTRGRFGLGFPSGGGGDVNGDGYDDLAFCAMDVDRTTFMNVLYGRPSDDDGILRTQETVDGSGRGFAVGGSVDFSSESGTIRIVGDLNGDGFDDIAMGSPSHLTPDAGGVFVVFGGPSGRPAPTLAGLRQGQGGYTIEGTVAGTQLGWTLDGGDVDGDGLDDLVIGQPRAAGPAGEANAGRVIIEFGRNYSGAISQYGGPSDDRLDGTPAAESLIGGRGDDVLTGGGGADVLSGGAGDDELRVADADFRRARGGAGEDTLVLGAGVAGLDLTGLARGKVREIERLTLTGQTLALSKLAVAGLSDTSNRLKVRGGGTVSTLAGDRWRFLGRVTEPESDYLRLADGVVELWIGPGLETRIPPTVLDGETSIPENAASNEVVAQLGAVDPDGSDANLRWVMLDDESGAFELDTDDGELRVVVPEALDFETVVRPWAIEVMVTDEDGLSTFGTFAVGLEDRPEPPVFVTTVPRWSAEEDAIGNIGSVVAVDQDRDDVITYEITSDPSGLFQIDPQTGKVALKSGLGLDYETATSHDLGIVARDASGLTASVTAHLEVLDRDVLERHARVTFDVRDWSIWGDEASNYFDGFQIEGMTEAEVATTCVEQLPGDQSHSETWTAQFPNALGALTSIPVRFDARYLGKICTGNSLKYDSGTFNATVPVDIDLTFPDEVRPGQLITIGSTAAPAFEGAGLWGRTTGIEMRWKLQFVDFGVYLAMCESLFTNTCKVAIDRQGLNGTFNDRFGALPKPWTAGQLEDPSRWVLTVGEAVELDRLDFLINWDQYAFNALRLLGLPSNRGRIETVLNGAAGGPGQDITIRFDYVIMKTDVGFQADNKWLFWLEYRGVDARLTFEDGSTATFRVGTPAEVRVPTSGDTNGDGRVDVSIAFTLDSEFNNIWDHRETAGYVYTGGFGRFRALWPDGSIVGQRDVGPAMNHFCAPKGRGDPFTPLKCYVSHGTDQTTFRPTGFSTPTLLGGLDLTR